MFNDQWRNWKLFAYHTYTHTNNRCHEARNKIERDVEEETELIEKKEEEKGIFSHKVCVNAERACRRYLCQNCILLPNAFEGPNIFRFEKWHLLFRDFFRIYFSAGRAQCTLSQLFIYVSTVIYLFYPSRSFQIVFVFLFCTLLFHNKLMVFFLRFQTNDMTTKRNKLNLWSNDLVILFFNKRVCVLYVCLRKHHCNWDIAYCFILFT